MSTKVRKKLGIYHLTIDGSFGSDAIVIADSPDDARALAAEGCAHDWSAAGSRYLGAAYPDDALPEVVYLHES